MCTRLSDYSLDLEREALQALMEVLATLQHSLGHLDAVPGVSKACGACAPLISHAFGISRE